MKTSNWQYTDNQFENATLESYRLAVELSEYHDAQLFTQKAAHDELETIYERYHPLHLDLVSEYNLWKTADAQQMSKTEALQLALDNAYGQMQRWDVAVQQFYLKGTVEYTAVFPHGRKPFNRGALDERINAYDTLAKNMGQYDLLETTMLDVAETYSQLNELRDRQSGAKGTVKTGSSKVEDARIAAMGMQWRNLGFAIETYWDDVPFIESLFDLENLRHKQQTKFTGKLAPSANKAILTHTFMANDTIRLKVNGDAAIRFYLATTENGTNSEMIEVAAHEERTIEAAEFGIDDYALHRFLTGCNQSNLVETHFIVELK